MKDKRQEKILEIIRNEIVLTQDDIQRELEKRGFNATQSTVSRDIKELRLVKGHDANGNYRYIISEVPTGGVQPIKQYNELFSNSVISVEDAMNDIVIKCHNGMASGACVAIDSLYKDRMLGSIAGDDTIFIITRSTQEAQLLSYELKKLI